MRPSDLLQAMLDAGAPIEAAMIALRALEAKDAEIAERDAAIAEKRAKDAARKKEERAAAKAGRVHGQSTDSPATVQDAPLSRPPNENNSNPPTQNPGDIYPARKGPFPMLDCTDGETWADFLRNRKAKRLPNTASAHRKLETDLAALVARTGWPPGKLFAACVARGWGAIYDPTEGELKNGRTNANRQTAPDGRAMGRTEAAARAVAARMASPGQPGNGDGGIVALPDAVRPDRNVLGGPDRMAIGGSG